MSSLTALAQFLMLKTSTFFQSSEAKRRQFRQRTINFRLFKESSLLLWRDTSPARITELSLQVLLTCAPMKRFKPQSKKEEWHRHQTSCFANSFSTGFSSSQVCSELQTFVTIKKENVAFLQIKVPARLTLKTTSSKTTLSSLLTSSRRQRASGLPTFRMTCNCNSRC